MPAPLRQRLLPAALLLAAAAVPARAAAADAGLEVFEKKVRPALVEHCYRCHSAEGKSPRGGLRVDTREGLRKGGDSGPAVVPGKPEASLLLRAIRYTDESLRMPPRGKLPAAVVADFERWVALGAPDPRSAAAAREGIDPGAASKHWAFQPVRRPAIPAVKDAGWARTPEDRFLLARLEARGLAPSGPADRRTLLRRVYFDLIGLPPTADEVDDFVA